MNIRYTISGDRNLGAHSPVTEELTGPDDDTMEPLTFKTALVLQRPVLDPCFAVGFLPLPSSGVRVGQLVTMNWRVERLKDSDENAASDDLVRNFTCCSVFQHSIPPKCVFTSLELRFTITKCLVSGICNMGVSGFPKHLP